MYALSSVAADDRLRSEFIWATNEGSSMCVHTHEGTSRRGNERTRERVALFGRDKRPLESDVCSQ